ncbi:BlaI family transcriptional regulator [Candidatus Uabimicrobium amorphum]|uniref:BlaI family transcriptional regulator n=2 Tax=Uabimicrobium amorphum TaxID=2596890 RepID=A0A5S9F103_UABAM|nr:BlaI family transcriptional regulator [Candidatus Uabimicrobium amorphum]
MKVCWEKRSCSAREVYEEVSPPKSWEYRTVKTMLDRLVEKGYLKREKDGNVCLYIATASQKAVTSTAIENFIATVLDNTVAPLFTHFSKGKKLNKEELSSLKKLIDEFEEE